ncbi:MAG: bifunctional phosphoribosyl-AMP cyclohydrolase/phosphoribosyl-ATP diphosphatase HisIE [Bdellovibrionales bacterium]|nr:bifunctional phosphoribosyl-AMP cyclohydrolase/phosphoribosyl-ATP diphosphatase HisIE [Bdellovibrionales bacterium]
MNSLANFKWPSELLPVIVQDIETKSVLMLAYMNETAWQKTVVTGKVTFFSRKRQKLWTKGETSGNYLEHISAHLDCDQDTILLTARPLGPTCHRGTRTCFDGDESQKASSLFFFDELQKIIEFRFKKLPKKSYITSLIESGLDRMIQKVGEEAIETVIAAKNLDRENLIAESADLLFHLMVMLQAKGISLFEISDLLRKRNS